MRCARDQGGEYVYPTLRWEPRSYEVLCPTDVRDKCNQNNNLGIFLGVIKKTNCRLLGKLFSKVVCLFHKLIQNQVRLQNTGIFFNLLVSFRFFLFLSKTSHLKFYSRNKNQIKILRITYIF